MTMAQPHRVPTLDEVIADPTKALASSEARRRGSKNGRSPAEDVRLEEIPLEVRQGVMRQKRGVKIVKLSGNALKTIREDGRVVLHDPPDPVLLERLRRLKPGEVLEPRESTGGGGGGASGSKAKPKKGSGHPELHPGYAMPANFLKGFGFGTVKFSTVDATGERVTLEVVGGGSGRSPDSKSYKYFLAHGRKKTTGKKPDGQKKKKGKGKSKDDDD